MFLCRLWSNVDGEQGEEPKMTSSGAPKKMRERRELRVSLHRS
jgi:hypothetical protein